MFVFSVSTLAENRDEISGGNGANTLWYARLHCPPVAQLEVAAAQHMEAEHPAVQHEVGADGGLWHVFDNVGPPGGFQPGSGGLDVVGVVFSGQPELRIGGAERLAGRAGVYGIELPQVSGICKDFEGICHEVVVACVGAVSGIVYARDMKPGLLVADCADSSAAV